MFKLIFIFWAIQIHLLFASDPSLFKEEYIIGKLNCPQAGKKCLLIENPSSFSQKSYSLLLRNSKLPFIGTSYNGNIVKVSGKKHDGTFEVYGISLAMLNSKFLAK